MDAIGLSLSMKCVGILIGQSVELNLDPGFDADLMLALSALERGWLSREAIEDAILAYDRIAGSRLLNLLPLTTEQRQRLFLPGVSGLIDDTGKSGR